MAYRRTTAVLVLFVLPSLLLAETREEKIAAARKTLQSGKDAKARVEAIQEMAKIGQLAISLAKPCIPDLLKALKDKDAKVRAAAAAAIGQLDPENKKEVVTELIKLVKDDKDDAVKQGAATGLASIGPDAADAIPALREAQKKTTDKNEARAFQMAIQAISGKKK